MSRRYNLIPTSYWQEVADWPEDERMLGMYLLTCSHRTSSEGLYRLRPAYAALDTGWAVERFVAGLQALADRRWLSWDAERSIVLLRRPMEDQPPVGARQVRGAARAVADIPRASPLYAEFVELAAQLCPALAAELRGDSPPPPPQTRSDTHQNDPPTASDTHSDESSDPASVPSSFPLPGSAAAASGAGALEAAGGGTDQLVTPMAWPAVRAMLQGRGFGEDEIERDRPKIWALLAETDRQLDWARGGRQLDEDRAAGRWQVHRPSAAVSYLLRQARPPLLGVPPAAPTRGQGRPAGARQPATAEHLAAPWAAVIEDARRQIDDARWDTWLSVLEPVADTGGELMIYAPDHARSWIGDRLLPLLSASATRALDRRVTVVLHGHHDARQAVTA